MNNDLNKKISDAMELALKKAKEKKPNKLFTQITEILSSIEKGLKKRYEDVFILTPPRFNTQGLEDYSVVLNYGRNKCCNLYLFEFEIKNDTVLFSLKQKPINDLKEIDDTIIDYFRDKNNLLNITSVLRKKLDQENSDY